MIKAGEINDRVETIRLGHVGRARATQIIDLLLLAPDIREAILFLPRTQSAALAAIRLPPDHGVAPS